MESCIYGDDLEGSAEEFFLEPGTESNFRGGLT
jgi:hypothetical protein